MNWLLFSTNAVNVSSSVKPELDFKNIHGRHGIDHGDRGHKGVRTYWNCSCRRKTLNSDEVWYTTQDYRAKQHTTAIKFLPERASYYLYKVQRIN